LDIWIDGKQSRGGLPNLSTNPAIQQSNRGSSFKSGYNFQIKDTILHLGLRHPSRHNPPNRSGRKLDYDCNIDAQVAPFGFFYMGVPTATS
jgi:hypothetical protein